MNILGISAFYHDSAVCLLQKGEIVAAAQEERFTRKKHDFAFPRNALLYCLEEADISIEQIHAVAFYDKPILKFERLLNTYLTTAPRGYVSFAKALPLWLKEKLWTPHLIREELGDRYKGKILFTEHHQSHAGSAFFPSPFEDAAVLTIDGVGEWATNSVSFGKANTLSPLHELHFPHSLGLLYSAFTYFTGFKVNSGEYKLMGLAPYGEPTFVQTIVDEVITIKEDGSYRLNLSLFDFMTGLKMTNDRFAELFGGPRRAPESPLTQREMDLARSIQVVTEDVMIRQARFARQVTGSKNLCLAGGVALNCVGNGRLYKEKIFDSIWVQPASGDAGGALGAALCCYHQHHGESRRSQAPRDLQSQSLLGPSFSDDEVNGRLTQYNAEGTLHSDDTLFSSVASLLAQEKVVGWFQGRMEFGPRALGNRSILGDPRSEKMQAVMNVKIKFRESFRPFAPAVLREKVHEYFEFEASSPYMLMVAPVQLERRRAMSKDEEKLFGIEKLNVPRSDVPAITHVDYSARLQTVDVNEHPRFYSLLTAFNDLTGCPLVINTSFNVRGEPIVCTPEHAYQCFMRTNMDVLVIGNMVYLKEKQPEWNESRDWKNEFELD
jgi:carbamoyltransferase